MNLYKNIKTGETLTESELHQFHIREWTNMFNDFNNYETHTFKNCGGTLQQWLKYKKDSTLLNNDFILIED